MKEDLRKALSGAQTLPELGRALSEIVREMLCCDRSQVQWAPRVQHTEHSDAGLGVQLSEESLLIGGTQVPLPLVLSDSSRTTLPSGAQREIERHGITSIVGIPLYHEGLLAGVLVAAYTSLYHRWRREEILQLEGYAEQASVHVSRVLTRALVAPTVEPRKDSPQESRDRFQKLAHYGNLIAVRTDAQLRVQEVNGDTERILGVSAEEFQRDSSIWRKLIHASDQRMLRLLMTRAELRELSEEVRVTNQKSGQERWILLHAVPTLDRDSAALIGWDGFAVDISEQHQAQEQALNQGRRIQALYDVAASLKLNVDPALVALRGLRSLIEATKSDCGFIALVESISSSLEIVATEGLSQSYVEAMNERIDSRSLARAAVDSKEGLLSDDIQLDPRAAVDIAKREGLRSTIIMPLVFEDLVLGVIVLFCHRPHQYTREDFDLVAAASSQIALAARQAELYLNEKRQASSVAALYRLSHELSKQLSLKEVAEQAFPVIQEELACKRIWLGVMNDRATHIAGVAGFGPGIRKHIIDVQVELALRHDFLDEALRKKQPVVAKVDSSMECSGLNRIMRRLHIETFIVVPLVSLGQVVGVLVVEPAVPSAFFAQRKLPLLTSMAGEIATVIIARKFEARMADADKMRMAGLLASGIAHNFNNLLQAVMGQASLIEMQSAPDSRNMHAARMIVDAATKGASLVKQLFSFSMQGSFSPTHVDLNQLLRDSQELYRSALGSSITLEFVLGSDAPEVIADYSQFQQVITNLLMNARDAIGENAGGKVLVSTSRVRLRSGEIDPELAPGVYFRIDVEDDGHGMDAEQQARCFEPFYTTKNADIRTGIGLSGSGLGLSSAYSIMKHHDGLITVKSQVGQGTVFSLYFPAVIVKSGELGREEHGREQRVRLLFYGLDQATLASLQASLASLGTNIETVGNVEDLFERVRQHGKNPSVVVLDNDYLAGRFAEIVRKLKEIEMPLRVIALCSERTRWEGLVRAYPFVHLIEKPLGLWSIHSIIRKAMLAQNTFAGLPHEIEREKTKNSRAEQERGTQIISRVAADLSEADLSKKDQTR